MTWRAVTIAAALVVALGFGAWVELPRLFDAFQPMIVATSIMVAGILVRLNRGMPTLDWKGLELDERKRLTEAVVGLNQEYLSILAANAIFGAGLVGLTVTSKPVILTTWSVGTMMIVSGMIGALLAICICRVAYMVWRDVDIVKLQKTLIDAAGERERQKEQEELAKKKVEASKGANLRRIEPTPIRDWSA